MMIGRNPLARQGGTQQRCTVRGDQFGFLGTTSTKKKIGLNGHCPFSSDPPPPRLNGQGGPFFLEVKNSGLNA